MDESDETLIQQTKEFWLGDLKFKQRLNISGGAYFSQETEKNGIQALMEKGSRLKCRELADPSVLKKLK